MKFILVILLFGLSLNLNAGGIDIFLTEKPLDVEKSSYIDTDYLKNLPWDVNFSMVKPLFTDEERAAPSDPEKEELFTIFLEYICLTLSRIETSFQVWNTPENGNKMIRFFKIFTPDEAATYLAEHFEIYKTIHFPFKDVILSGILSNLGEQGKLLWKIKPNAGPFDGQFIDKRGHIAFGKNVLFDHWQTYFTTAPTPSFRNLWLTKTGLAELFEFTQLIPTPEHQVFTESDKKSLATFSSWASSPIPVSIYKDITESKSIGVRSGFARELSLEDKEWLKKNLPHLSILSFLRYVNLRSMQLKELPESLKELTHLKELHLDDNLFKEIPSVLGSFNGNAKSLRVYASKNKIKEQNVREFISDLETMKLVSSKIDVKKLKWSPSIIQKTGVSDAEWTTPVGQHPLYLIFMLNYLTKLSIEKIAAHTGVDGPATLKQSEKLTEEMPAMLYGFLASMTPQSFIKLMQNRTRLMTMLIDYFIQTGPDQDITPFDVWNLDQKKEILKQLPAWAENLIGLGILNPIHVQDIQAASVKLSKEFNSRKKTKKNENLSFLEEHQRIERQKSELYQPLVDALSIDLCAITYTVAQELEIQRKFTKTTILGAETLIGAETFITQSSKNTFNGWLTEQGLAEMLVLFGIAVEEKDYADNR